LDSSNVLVQASSGLQKLMGGQKSSGVLKDSTVAQVSAAIYYQSTVISKLTTNKQFQNKFTKTIFNQIALDFGLYIDAKARTNPQSLHHVYEWGKAGDMNARLFKLNKVSQFGLSMGLTYEFKDSKTSVPSSFGKKRYVFKKKASIMEAGMPLIIRPRAAERLVFEIDGIVIRMPKGASVTVNKPGGGKATSRFKIAYSQFFTSNLVNLSIKKSGFQKMFNSDLAKASKLPSDIKRVKYSFSPNTLNMQAESAISAAFGGAA
jgi:hypothetical protein